MDHATQAGVFRGALLLGLIRGEEVVGWADRVIDANPSAPPLLIELSTTSPGDITVLRQLLFDIGGEGNSAAVVGRIIGLVRRDLASGRRGFADTMTVLKQLRAFIKLDRDLNEHLKALGVDVALGRDGAEARVRAWLQSFA